MKIVKTIAELNEAKLTFGENKSIGLVPTMGALHNGHASLVKRSVKENDFTIVSVFVNPTQFNDKNDLKNYPRTLEADCTLLESLGTDIVFAPSVEEIYPEEDTRVFDFSPLDKVMEGKYRPGHFNGVAQIVSKLFDMVEPTKAYFGEKDFQQLAIIRELVHQYGYCIDIVPCPIVREADGLALSSRNALLSEEERQHALMISKTLFLSRDYAETHSISETLKFVEENINNEGYLRLEYFEIVDGDTLQPIKNWNDTDYAIGCITVFCGKVRLIDNIKYKG